MKTTYHFFLITILSITGAYAQQKPDEVELTIEIQGELSPKGQLLLNIYNSEESWLKGEYKIIKSDLSKQQNRIFIVEVDPGTYAISVVHDENKNNDLDMGMMGPTESYGFSNNARGRFGPADFKDAVLILNSNAKAKIKIY